MRLTLNSVPRLVATAMVLSVWAMCIAGAVDVQAQTMLVRGGALQADKLPAASAIGQLAGGQQVEVVSMEGNWALVSANIAGSGPASGWVLTERLMRPTSLVSGGTAQLGSRSLTPRSNRHALIIGIGNYADTGVPPLPGTRHDKVSATQMAQSMQVPPANIAYLQDGQATGQAIRKALSDLDTRTMPGDRVFIHYSGHGTRYNDAAAGGCVEALLSYDSDTITNREIADLLRPITTKTDKLFVMYDACHSGGLIANQSVLRTRGLVNSNDEGRIRPKFSSITEECGRPVNVKTRNLVVEQSSKGVFPQDVIMLSASRDNEISFDDELKGGLATQFMRDCMLRDAKDLDNSGAISIDEVRQCAQEKINKRMLNDSQFKPHTLTLSGNSQFVPAWFARVSEAAVYAYTSAAAALATGANSAIASVAALRPGSGQTQTSPISTATAFAAPVTPATPAPPVAAAAPSTSPNAAVLSVAVGAPIVSTPVAQPAAAAAASLVPLVPMIAPSLSSAQAMQQLFDQRDAKRKVTVIAPRQTLKIGRDTFDLSVKSEREGHVYVLLAGSDNKSAYVLFPNALDVDNRIRAGQTLALPRPSWQVRAAGPAGVDTVLVLVTDGPRDLKSLQASSIGPFMSSLNDSNGRAQLGAWVSASSGGGAAACARPAGGGNTNDVPISCSDAFGAAMLSITETP